MGRPHHASPQTLDRLDQRLEPGGIEAVIVGEEEFHEWKVWAVVVGRWSADRRTDSPAQMT